jgi:hypothetical protein
MAVTGLEPLVVAVTKAVFAHVATQTVKAALPEDKVRRLLGRDPQQRAFQASLTNAMSAFRGRHPDYAGSLFDQPFLAGAAAPILARCLTGPAPEPEELARAWDKQFGATHESKRSQYIAAAAPVAAEFLELLEQQLRGREEFRLLYGSRDLYETARHTGETAQTLQELSDRLDALLLSIFDLRNKAPGSLVGYWRDSRHDCEAWTTDFVGRGFVFDALDERLRSPDFPSGYVVIRGEPGIGKTALMAQLVKTRGYVHHFNNALEGVRSPKEFLGNACAQLIVRYGLGWRELPLPRATSDSGFLKELLTQAAERAAAEGETPIVIAVDALDEAERQPGANPLYLPRVLPQGVYIVVTSRLQMDYPLQVERRSEDIFIDERDEANTNDVLAYIRNFLDTYRDEMAVPLARWKVGEAEFSDELVRHSEGNFRYLVHVLGDIRDQRPIGKVARLQQLPQGLKAYYQLYWEGMRDQDRERFRRYQKPVVSMLATAHEPVTAEMVTDWVNARSGKHRELSVDEVIEVLVEWWEFLNVEPGDPPTYRIFHASFAEFLDRTVNLTSYRAQATNAPLKQLGW